MICRQARPGTRPRGGFPGVVSSRRRRAVPASLFLRRPGSGSRLDAAAGHVGNAPGKAVIGWSRRPDGRRRAARSHGQVRDRLRHLVGWWRDRSPCCPTGW